MNAGKDKLRKEDWCVMPVAYAVARLMTAKYHYARGGSNTATYTHGLFRIGSWQHCKGICWWLPPTKSAAIASWDGDWQQVLSLSRMVILPDVPSNAASFMLSRSTKIIAARGRFRCLVTYADTWQGHTGAIYKAANWEYVGETKPSVIWVNAKGRMVARKAGPRTRTKQQMVDLGYTPLGSFSKHKFRLILPTPKPRNTIANRE